MKQRSFLLTAMLLVLAVACGMLLPRVVAWASDLGREEVTAYSFDIVRIDCSSYSIVEKLGLTQSGMTYEVETDSTLRTAEEATKLCKDFLRKLLPGMDAELQASAEEARAYLTFSGEASMVLWGVTLDVKDQFQGYFVVDDTSGAVLRFTLHPANDDLVQSILGIDLQDAVSEFSELSVLAALEQFGQLTMNLIAELYQAKEVYFNVQALEYQESHIFAMFILSFVDENGQIAECPLCFDGAMLSFN